MKNGRTKINEMITKKMIERITATNTLPWRKPWSSANQWPRNLISKKQYRGVNAFLLHSMGYEQPWFLTMKQINSLGGKIRKGEKACPVIFWTFVEPKEDEDKAGYAVLRYYRVFNVAQCEGLKPGKVPEQEVVRNEIDPLEAAETLIQAMPDAPVIRTGCRQAAYSPSADVVSMPNMPTFNSAAGYYATLFHELSHATGHEKRVGRKAIMKPHGFGSHAYSQEELVAEMSAAFLCGQCGILPEVEENAAAYLKHWIERLKAEPAMLIQAGQQAQKAFDYIIHEGDEARKPLPKRELCKF